MNISVNLLTSDEKKEMNFCLPLAGKLIHQEINGSSNNIVVSPLSLNVLVATMAAGCSGRTLDRLLSFVGCTNLDELRCTMSKMLSIFSSTTTSGWTSSPKISMVNGVWADKRSALKPTYQQLVACGTDLFKSEAKNVDFLNQADEVVKEINSWAESQTNGLIKGILQSGHVTPLTTLVLGNALYFEGAWEDRFHPEFTHKRDFFLVNGDKISSVPFMTRPILQYGSFLYGSFHDFKVLEIPYESRRGDKKKYSMLLILPNRIDGLQNLLRKFDLDCGFLNRDFKLRKTKLNEFGIPKFKFSTSLDKIKFPFMEEHRELTEMFQVHDPSISNIVQRAFIEVDESGTKAAAVSLEIYPGCAPPEKQEIKTFVADHPFMFIVKENTSGVVLFTGAVLNPLVE